MDETWTAHIFKEFEKLLSVLILIALLKFDGDLKKSCFMTATTMQVVVNH